MKKIFAILLTAVCVSCVTPSDTLRGGQFKSIPSSASGLIIPAEVKGKDSTQCRMELSDAKGQSYKIFFEVGEDLYFTALAPGNYQVTRLACAHGSYYIENQPYWSRVVINEGNLSFFAPVKFNPAEQKALIQFPTREQTREAFQQTLGELSSRDKDRLVNAADGRKMTDKMKDIQKVVLFHFSANQSDGYDQFKNSVMECEQKEISQNHVVLGKTDYQLFYRQGKFDKLTGGARNTSTFSQTFFDCVEQIFRDFKPEKKTDLKVDVSF